MKIYSNKKLNEFKFWSGAIDTMKKLTNEELEQIEQILEECYPEGISEGELNDFFGLKTIQ